MKVSISKSSAKGIISAPPSKSLSHRYIICAAMSEGEGIVRNLSYSEDISATLDCIRALGAKAVIEGNCATITGTKGPCAEDHVDFYCRESGSTMRFFMGIAMLYGCDSYFYGSETLRNRPMGIYEEICAKQGILFEREKEYIHVHGKLNPGVYEVPGNISSQFISGLMFALPKLDGNSTIKLIPPVESRSYIDLTIQSLAKYGVKTKWISDTELAIEGNSRYITGDITVEGDYSNAAFLDAFNACGGCVETTGLDADSLQGDRVYKELFAKLCKEKATIDISDCPDLGPVLFAVAAANKGGIFTGTKRLKIKESDRGAVMCKELEKFGAKTVYDDEKIEIVGNEITPPTEAIYGHNDHRIVMSFALLLSLIGGTIDGAEAVKKSYPNFFEDIAKLGVEVKKDGMD